MLNILGKYKNRKGFYQSKVIGMVLVMVLMVLDPQFRISVLHYTKYLLSRSRISRSPHSDTACPTFNTMKNAYLYLSKCINSDHLCYIYLASFTSPAKSIP